MKKSLLLILSFTLIATTASTVAPKASAQNPLNRACSQLTEAQKKQSTACNDTVDERPDGTKYNPIYGPDGILMKITNVVSMVAGVIAVIMIIVSSIAMITSSGDSQRFSQARNGVIYSAIGIVIILVAQGLVRFVINRL